MTKFKSKQIHIDKAIAGMQLSKAILTDEGKVALTEGTLLSRSLVERLRSWGITHIAICEGVEDTGPSFMPPSPQQEFFDIYEGTVNTVKKAFETIRTLKTIPIGEVNSLVSQAINPMLQSSGVINHLHMVRRQDDYTFHHSVNVAVIAGVLGKWLGLDDLELRHLTLAGLLHDVGKTQIPLHILNKPGKLSEDEMQIMKQHTALGFQIVKRIRGIPATVRYGVLQHHEKMDGSGYPLNFTSDKIHLFAKIISVADIYDAMTSDRVYHRKVSPFEVVEMMLKEMYNKLDPTVCNVFLNNVRDYFWGNLVELSNGQVAEVVYLGHFIGSRPVVRTMAGEFIDLEKRKDYCIKRLVKT